MEKSFLITYVCCMEIVVQDKNKRIISEQDVRIVQMLSNGVTSRQAAIEIGMNARTFESKVFRLKTDLDANTIAHLVATFLRKELIK